MNKLFAIGFQKTGTTSLTYAARLLGHRLGNPSNKIMDLIKAGEITRGEPDIEEKIMKAVFEVCDTKDGLNDSPAPFVFDQLDERYPGSKFVLTYRSPDSWIKSLKSHFPGKTNALRHWMYGLDSVTGNEDKIKEIYLSQNQKIRDYFADRPEDFLELNFENGDGWYELVTFLGKDGVGSFPQRNTKRKRIKRNKKRAKLKKSGKAT